jgi:hypothetical protein
MTQSRLTIFQSEGKTLALRFSFKFYQSKLCVHFRFKNTMPLPEVYDETIFAQHENKLTTLYYRNRYNARKAQPGNEGLSIHLLDEDTVTLQFSLMTFRYNPLNKNFLEKIDQLITGGIVEHGLESDNSIGHSKTRLNSKTKVEDKKPEPLKMDHLGVCFAAILICLGLSCVVFFMEFLSKHLIDQFRNQ